MLIKSEFSGSVYIEEVFVNIFIVIRFKQKLNFLISYNLITGLFESKNISEELRNNKSVIYVEAPLNYFKLCT